MRSSVAGEGRTLPAMTFAKYGSDKSSIRAKRFRLNPFLNAASFPFVSATSITSSIDLNISLPYNLFECEMLLEKLQSGLEFLFEELKERTQESGELPESFVLSWMQASPCSALFKPAKKGKWTLTPLSSSASPGLPLGVKLSAESLCFYFLFAASWRELAGRIGLFLACFFPEHPQAESFSRSVLATWLLACALRLRELEHPKWDTLLRLALSPEAPEELLEQGKEIVAECWQELPSPEDAEAQSRILLKHQDAFPFARGFLDEQSKAIRRFWKSLRERRVPIVFFGGSFLKEEDYLAQMAVWALKQGESDAELYAFLKSYIAKTTECGERLAEEVLSHLIEKWKTPLSYLSFLRYLRQLVRKLRPAEAQYEGEEEGFVVVQEAKVSDFPVSLWKASEYLAQELHLKPQGVYLTLYRQIRQGKLEAGRVRSRIMEDGTVVVSREYMLSKEAFDAARKYLEERILRRLLIESYRKKRNVTRRAAEIWLKKQVESGKDVKSIAWEWFRGNAEEARH